MRPALLLALALLSVQATTAQDLVDLFQRARLVAETRKAIAEHGLRADVLPPVPLTHSDPSVRERLARMTPPPAPAPPPPPSGPAFRVLKWDKVSRLENAWFEQRFDDVNWAYLGSNYLTELDTTWTRVLRGRLQTRFGAPTRTLADLDIDGLRADDHIQFEYRFVVNDTLPLVVLDTGGPFERGVVVASDSRYRDHLFALRQALLDALHLASGPAPYADYFFNAREQAWYRTGYDGTGYFARRISRPDLSRGRPLVTTRD